MNKLKKHINVAILSVATLAMANCSTMLGRADQTIAFETATGESLKAEIRTPDGTYVKTIPSKLTIEKSWGGVSVTVVDKCYHTADKKVGSAIDNTFWLNALNLFSFWWIDALTASMFEFDAVTVIPANRKETPECQNEQNSNNGSASNSSAKKSININVNQ